MSGENLEEDNSSRTKTKDLLNPTENNAFRVRIDNPILSSQEFYKIRNLDSKGIRAEIVSICYDYEDEDWYEDEDEDTCQSTIGGREISEASTDNRC